MIQVILCVCVCEHACAAFSTKHQGQKTEHFQLLQGKLFVKEENKSRFPSIVYSEQTEQDWEKYQSLSSKSLFRINKIKIPKCNNM